MTPEERPERMRQLRDFWRTRLLGKSDEAAVLALLALQEQTARAAEDAAYERAAAAAETFDGPYAVEENETSGKIAAQIRALKSTSGEPPAGPKEK